MKVLITGASRGIGKAIAEVFAANGYELEIPGRQELNLDDLDSIKNYVKQHRDTPLDALINNAGINLITNLADADENVIHSMMNVDLIEPIYLLKGSIARLKKSDAGRIVNIGSVWAKVSKPGRSLYSAAKNGMHGLTNTLALELAQDNILVNTVCPGFVRTELTIQNNTPQEIGEIERLIPLQRMAEPAEIAKVVYFLGSFENSYITGQKILVDGGYCAQ